MRCEHPGEVRMEWYDKARLQWKRNKGGKKIWFYLHFRHGNALPPLWNVQTNIHQRKTQKKKKTEYVIVVVMSAGDIYFFNYEGLFRTNIFSLTSFITVSAQQRHSAHWNTPGLYWAPLATSEPMMSSWWMSQQDGDQQVCETRSAAGRDLVCRTWT